MNTIIMTVLIPYTSREHIPKGSELGLRRHTMVVYSKTDGEYFLPSIPT